ncbi:MAG: hypothetical protein JWQ01_2998 [Massilia sp.]|nr:hypothetical protein [Massilia sp.]
MSTTCGRIVAATLITAILAGCAVSQEKFYANRYGLTEAQLCRTLAASNTQAAPAFLREVREEAERRNLSDSACVEMNRRQSAAIGASVLLAVAVVAAARRSGGGAGASADAADDTSWEWDQFYNAGRQLVWACRGVQTGQFANQYNCASKAQIDWKWPGK